MHVQRLETKDRDRAREMFTLLASIFNTEAKTLSDSYIDTLLEQDHFWALVAVTEDRAVGGLTAYTLPLTQNAECELLIYDIAVSPTYQRQGIGKLLIHSLMFQAKAAGIHEVIVLADNEDIHALDFYRAIGGRSTSVTLFSLSVADFLS